MEFLFEMLLELIDEGTVKLSKSKKVPNYIRYPLIVIIVLFYAGIIGIVLFAGVVSFQQNFILGIILIAGALLISIVVAVKFRKIYLIRKNLK